MHFNFEKKMRLYCSVLFTLIAQLFDKNGKVKKRTVKGTKLDPGEVDEQEEEKLEGLHALN